MDLAIPAAALSFLYIALLILVPILILMITYYVSNVLRYTKRSYLELREVVSALQAIYEALERQPR